MPRVADLQPDADPATVARIASYLAKNFDGWGALESADFRSAAVLRFYEVRDHWKGVGCFGHYVVRCMAGAIKDAFRREARHQTGFARVKTGLSSKGVPALSEGVISPAESNKGGFSASPTLPARTRRQASRREHNRTYYYRTRGLQECELCGTLVQRGHGARRCEACISPVARSARRRRECRREEAA